MTTTELSHKLLKPSAVILAMSLLFATSILLIQPSMASAIYDVTIIDDGEMWFSFDPEVRCIEKRDEVVWTNNANNGPAICTLYFVFDENKSGYLLSDPIPLGQTWSHNFTEATKLLYYDLAHLWVSGKLRIYYLFGDVNWDNIVDGADFSLMGGAYRAEPGDANWNENCDINGDNIVDGADFSIAGGNYRKTDP